MILLLLEDNYGDKELLLKYLQRSPLDFVLHHASNKDEFENLLVQQKPDLVLSDYNVPGFDVEDAYELCHKQNPHVPFIIVSGELPQNEAVRLITEVGVSDYIIKDDLSRLYDAIVRKIRASETAIELDQTKKLLQLKNEELNKLSLVASNTQTGVVITDSTGHIDWVNRSFTRISGYSFEEVKGKKPGNILQGQLTNKDNVNYIRECIKERVPVTTELINYHKNGTTYWIRLNIAPVINNNGELTNFIGVQEDISDQKRMENDIQAQILRLTRAQKAATMADWTFDVSTQEITWSEGLYSIYERNENLSAPTFTELFDYYPLSESERLKELIKLAIEKGEGYDEELEIRAGDSKKNIRHVCIPSVDSDGEVIKLFGIIQDITNVSQLKEDNRESEQRLDAAVEGADLGVWDLNLINGENYTNNRWWNMLGYSKGEIDYTIDFFLDILHPEDKDKPAQEIERIENGGENKIDLILRMRHKNGSYRTILDRGRVVKFNDDGKAQRLIGTHHDITELQELEEELKENKFRLETAVEGADLGIWDSNLKKQSTVANSRWHEMLGYKPGEINGSHNLYKLFFESLHPEDKVKIKNELGSLKKGKKESFELVLRVKNRSGKYFHILDKGKVLEFDPEGNAVRMIGTVLDITERIKLENKLKDSQFRLETAVEGASLGIWDANIRDETNIANDRWYEMLGFDRDEIDDSFAFFFSRVHPDDLDHIKSEIRATEKGDKSSFSVIVRVKHKSGDYITILDKGTALEYDKEGVATRMIGTHLDITELVTTQIMLEKSLEEKDILLQEVHHRVKNNLAVLVGLLELDIFAHGDHPSLTEAINRIRSISMVHELLYHSQSMIEIDFGKYMESFVAQMRKALNMNENIKINWDISVELINVNEAVPLGLLVNELITNSYKHALKGSGEINISLHKTNTVKETNIFSYMDSGTGYDPDNSNENLGGQLIRALLENLGAEYTIETDGKFKITATYAPKLKGAYGHPINTQ